jgi:DNA-binding FadR family transcriptional regulator
MRPLDRTSLTEQAAEAIKRRILTHHLQTGDRLPSERKLCKSLKISRSILREALSTLVGQGIVTKVQGKGIFVGEFDRQNLGVSIRLTITDKAKLGALRDLRTILELGVLELITQRITLDELDQLEEEVNEIEQHLLQGEQVNELDTAFHLSLFKMAHAPALLELYAQVLEDASNVTIFQAPEMQGILDKYITAENLALLRQVLAAVRRGDVCDAQRAMKEHIFTTSKILESEEM